MNKTRIIDNTYYSIGFPNEDWDKLIKRDNYLSQIKDYLDNEVKILFIEGEDDSGKTTLCGQFAKKNESHTITVFFNPHNKNDFQIDYYCANVVYQIKNILKDNLSSFDSDEVITIETYRHFLFQLRKKRNKAHGKVYLILDGLENVKENIEFINQLFEILPLGEELFRIIISGNQNDFLSLCPRLRKQELKPINLTGFSQPEIIEYLEIDEKIDAELQDIFNITKGYPGRLKTLKRLIKKDNYSLQDITKTTKYKNWIELDCDSIDINDPIISTILSILSLSEKSFQVEEISKICSLEIKKTKELLQKIYVIKSTENSLGFISNSHKKYFANIFRGNYKKTSELLIKYYASDDRINSRFELSKLYYENNEWSKIINLFDENYLKSIVENTGTLQRVNESLELGVKASENSKKYTAMWRFSIQGSIVNELDNYLFWESEIKARISINDFAGATLLAESAVLKVDRLRLLILIARKQKEINNKVDEDLINLIKELYNGIDISSVGSKIYDIVADLIYAIPNLAIEMIEKSSDSASEKNINDWIIAKLSLAAIDSSSKNNDETDTTKKLEAVQSLNNPSVRKIHRAISFLVGNYTSIRVLEEVRKLSDSNERLRLLRLWLNNNRKNVKDVDKVIESALDELVLSSSESTLTLDVLMDLSYQLPYVKDIKIRKSLYERFKLIENDFLDFGLSKNIFIYKLNIFQTEFSFNKHNSIKTLNSIITKIEELSDVLIKLESFSEVYSKLRILKYDELTNKSKFVYSRLLSLSEELFRITANHYKVSESFVKTIAKRSPLLALKICEQINTSFRKERARLLILDSYLDNNLKFINLNFLKEIERAFEKSISKQTAYIRILERYSESKGLHYNTIKELFYFTNKIDLIKDSSEKVYGYILSFKIISKNATWKTRLSKTIEQNIFKTWQEIEADWERIDNGFIICSELAIINEVFSKKVFVDSEKLKRDSWIDSSLVAYTYLNSMKLIIRAYTGLLITNNETDKNYQILEDLIFRIPSEVEKLKLWTEISFNANLANNEKVFKNILDTHILPLTQDIINKRIDLEPILNSFVLIHIFNSDIALDYINKVTFDSREEVYSTICDYYITKKSPYELYDNSISKYNTTYSDLIKAISVLSYISTDNIIYKIIDNICKAIIDNKNKISKSQITTIISKLEAIINSKLPDQGNIKHQGYKILSETKIAIVKKGVIDWQKFIDESKLITNVSDSIFVKAVLLESILFEKISNGNAIKSQLFEDVISSLNSLPIHYEFVQRVIDISEIMYNINREKWKTVVNKAFSLSTKLENGSEIYNSQKNIIDSMHRLDPSFAKELIKSVDKENPENRMGKLLNNYYETLEISNKIKNNQILAQKEKEDYRMVVRGVLNAQRALNSEKIVTKKIPEVSSYLPIGNKLPLHEVFPIYMYYLSNCARTYSSKKMEGTVANLHEENFKEAVNATNLIQLLSQRRKFNEKSYRDFFIDEDFAANKPIRPGSSDEAMTFIKNWMHDEVDEFIIIADPYIKKEDLVILKLVKELDENLIIDILGSEDGQKSNIEDDYKKYWKKISDELPPFTNITFCWVPDDNNNKPIHDRWIISKNSGLRLGTSINSFGKKRESEISIMKPNEALNILENTLKDYINRRKREINNQRISYKSFNL